MIRDMILLSYHIITLFPPFHMINNVESRSRNERGSILAVFSINLAFPTASKKIF